jgi:CHAT domain-containing protein/tetratricopeptide (TPR) repeat protein
MALLGIFVSLCFCAMGAESRGDAELKRAEELRKKGTPAARREALQAYESAASAYRESGDLKGLGNATHATGRILFDLEDHRRAIVVLEEAITLRRSTGSPVDLSNSIQTLGACWGALGENRKAIGFYEEALAIRRAENDRPGMATSLFGMAVAYWMLGDTQKAIRTYEEVLSLRRSLKDAYGEAHALNAMGLAHAAAGDHRTAMQRYQQALSIWRRLANRSGEAYTLNNIGLIQAANRNFRAALASYSAARKMLTELEEKRGLSYASNNAAAAHAELREWDQAEALYTEGLQRSRDIGDRNGEATSLAGIARMRLDQKDAQGAVDPAQRAVELRKAIGDRAGEAATLAILAKAKRQIGDTEEAARHYASALDLVEALRGQFSRQMLKAAHLESTQPFYEDYIALLMETGREAEAFAISERSRARVLLDLLAESKADVRRGADATLLDREKELRSEINAAAQRLQQAPSAAARAQMEELLRAWDALDAELRTSSPRYSALVRPRTLSVDELRQQLLDDGTALLEFHLAHPRSYAWLITPTAIRSAVLPPRARIEALARTMYEALDGRHEAAQEENAELRRLRMEERDRSFQQSARALSAALFGKFAQDLKVRRLLIVPDGALHLAPFAALPLPGGTQPMVTRIEPHILPSASIVAQLRAAKPPRADWTTLSILADPVFQREDARFPQGSVVNVASRPAPSATGYPRLHFSRIEADAVSRLLPPGRVRRALDFQASRSALERPSFLKSRILHLATHAVIQEDQPSLSGIVFSMVDSNGKPADGLLRTYEIYNLSLESDLVVLSACRTALGRQMRGEGVIGLTRAFLHAGASSVVTSLWSIQDRATAKLMEHFYQGLLQQSLSPAAALRQAQLRLRSDGRFAHPYFWAAFSVQGDGR